MPVPPVGGAVVPPGEAVVPGLALGPESPPLVSWNAITASAAARATPSAITSTDGRPRGGLAGPPGPRPESPGGAGGRLLGRRALGHRHDLWRRAVARCLAGSRVGDRPRRPVVRVAEGADRLGEVARDVGGVGVAMLGPLGHGARTDLVDRRREVRPQVGDPRDGVLDVGEEHGHVAVARVGHRACQALVEHAPERVHVGALVGLAPLHLLRGHVVDGAEELPGVGQARARDLVLHEPEVSQICVVDRLAVGSRPLGQDVGGLDVAVDEAALVRDAQPARDLRDDVGRPSQRQRALLPDQRLQVGAGDVSHRDVEEAVLLARVVDRDDVRVVDRRRETRLAHEPLAKGVVLRELGAQHLERDLVPEAHVVGPEDDAHAAAPEHSLDAIRGEVRAHAGHVADARRGAGTGRVGRLMSMISHRDLLPARSRPWSASASALPVA